MKTIHWKTLLISLGISLGTGALSAALTADSMEKYRQMYKPPFSPPGWVFPVVWTILFVLMGIAAWLVYESGSTDTGQALRLYALQLAVNAVWPILFFKFDLYLLSFAWLLLLWYLVYLVTARFCKIVPAAGALMVLYLVWLTFAGYLNLAIAIHYWKV